jgi:hypothetical protein
LAEDPGRREPVTPYVWPDVAGILVLGLALFAFSIARFGRLVR